MRTRWPSTGRAGPRNPGAAAERLHDGRQSVPLQRRHDHHAVAGGQPVGCAVPRLLRRSALQRLPGGFGDQHGRLPLRHRQGRRQGHHLARRAAGPGSPPGRGGLPRSRQSDLAGRTRRRGPRPGRDDRARRHRADPDRLVGKVSHDREQDRRLFRAGLAMRVVAARSRDRRGGRRQPSGRRPGIRCRGDHLPLCTCCACATWE